MSIHLEDVNLSPENVSEALVSLEAVAARFYAIRDRRAVFPDVYGIITRNVKLAIQDRSSILFLEPAWLSRMAGRFCEKYMRALLRTMEGAWVESSAWRYAFHYAQSGATLPVQDAILGINAHINYDLAQGVCDNILSHGNGQDPRLLARYLHDHNAVNIILEESMPEICDVLIKRYRCYTTRWASSTRLCRACVTSSVMSVLRQWRTRVWGDAMALLNCQEEETRRQVLGRMDRLSGRMAIVLCTGNVAYMASRPMVPPAVHHLFETFKHERSSAGQMTARVCAALCQAPHLIHLPHVPRGLLPGQAEGRPSGTLVAL